MAAREGGVGKQGSREAGKQGAGVDSSGGGLGGKLMERGRARGRRRAGWQSWVGKAEEEAGGEGRGGRPGPWDPPSCPAQDRESDWSTPWRPWRSECVHLPPRLPAAVVHRVTPGGATP